MDSGSSGRPERRPLCRCCGAPCDARPVWSEGPWRVLGCPSCGLAALDPLPETGEMEEVYGEDYFRSYYLPFEEFRIAYFREQLRAMEAHAPGRRVLDVGCGVGYFLAAAAERGWEAAGVEPSPFGSRYARERFGLSVHQTAFGPGVPGAPYDAVTFWDVLAHVPRPCRYIAGGCALLREGGLMAVKSPDRSFAFWTLARALSRAVRTRGFLHIPAQINFFTRESMSHILETHGMEILDVRSIREIRLPLGWKQPKVKIERLLHDVLGLLGHPESFVILARKGAPPARP